MKITPEANCPLNQFEPCQQLKCAWFTKITGSNPNTGEHVDEWGCAVAWMPVLLVENSSQQRQTGAAVESFRNAMVESNKKSLNFLLRGQSELAAIGDV